MCIRDSIYGDRNGIHIIDLEKTIPQIASTCDFVQKLAAQSGTILFVGTKKSVKDSIKNAGVTCGMPYVSNRWLGGTLTNFSTIKKSIKRLKMLEKEGSNLYENMTKKETQMLNRERVKLADQHRGIKDMKRLPDAIIVVDAQYEDTAIREARRLDIPIIAIVDSNTDPNKVDYPIPANDDSMRTIQLIISALADSVVEARAVSSKKEDKPIETSDQNKSKEIVKTNNIEEVVEDTTQEEE